MEGFGPLLFVIILYLCFLYPLSKAKKKGTGQKRSYPQAPEAPKSPEPETEEPEDLTFQAGPTVRDRMPFGGDEELYRGSMNAVTGEGVDPCHDEQMESLRPEPVNTAAEAPEGGLRMNWTGNEIVKGFVMSEVLKRKH